jgi:WD40 repeat protein
MSWFHVRTLCAVALLTFTAGCGAQGTKDGEPNRFGAAESPDASLVFGGDASFVFAGSDASLTLSNGDGAEGSLEIVPADAVVNVTIQNGVVTAAPLTFQAIEGGHAVPVKFALNRGDLGTLDPTGGVFQATGVVAGVGAISATYGSLVASTSLTVRISVVRNGGPALIGDAGPGGPGGVGGEGPGSAADPTAFSGPMTAPASAQELSFLYPYDKTIWPRGILAPLLQWQTTHVASSVYVHLTQRDYEFKGYYAFAPSLTGAQLMRQPLDAQAWDQATHSNEGDPLHVEVFIAAADGVFGPIAEDWTIAPAILQGTVYYGSYNSSLNGTPGTVTGAVLAIQPGQTSPSLAIPSLQGSCHSCHEVSADGSTIFTNQVANTGASDYGFGGSYSLTSGASLIKSYDQTLETPGGLQYNDIIGKFTYSGVYPDGTFVLANSNDNFHCYNGNSDLFSRDTLLAVPSTGFTNIVSQAVTPAFSPDGRHVTFNFWQSMQGADAGVTAGNGASLAVMDFDCGAKAGSVTCAAPPYAFSNIREVYRDSTRVAGWPAFTPDGNSVVFQSTITPSNGGSPLNTYEGGTAELMIADARVPAKFAPQRLCALNGFDSDCTTSYLPVVPNHPNDTIYNYEPTVNPVASGGYYWVVFTTRRAYGNVAQGDPYETNTYSPIDHPVTKKLWVAAIDENPTAGKDPSHPAFYLPGQELEAGDMKGYWVVEPCRPDGSACTTGDECCDGFCREPPDGGALVCMPTAAGCSNLYEKCIQAADCCGAAQGYTCTNGRCAEPAAL